jgi:SAM-dependent methyltransferase
MAWQETMAAGPAIPRFGGWVDLYARYRPAYPAALIARLADATRHHGLCVELGAGTGQATEPLLALFDRVIAVEPDPAMAQALDPHPRLRVVEARAEDALLAAGEADAVAAFTALHWMPVERVLDRAAGWLRPEGVFFACGLAPAQFPGAPAAVSSVLRAYAGRWRGHTHQRLTTWRSVAACLTDAAAFTGVEAFEVYADFSWTPREAAGFLLSTSFGQAFAQATGDADLAFETLTQDLATAARGALIAVRIPVEGALARRR